MKICPKCKKETDLIMTDCGFGRLGESGPFDSGDCYYVRVHCNDCGVDFTVTSHHVAMTKEERILWG